MQVLKWEVLIDITVTGNSTRLSLDTSEAYTLGIEIKEQAVYISIFSLSYFGARHALETVSQLIVYDDVLGFLQASGNILFPFFISFYCQM